MFWHRRALIFLATGAGVGKIPFAPGTMGSAVGVAVAWMLARLNCPVGLGALIVLAGVAVAAAKAAEQELGRKDPGCIVIDEIVGMCVTLACLPPTWGNVLAGFCLFRLFDILKPPPVRWFESRFAGGWGVVLDDVAAGAIAHLILRITLALNL